MKDVVLFAFIFFLGIVSITLLEIFIEYVMRFFETKETRILRKINREIERKHNGTGT